MALVARISSKAGKAIRTVALRTGANILAAAPDAVVEVVDEATGKVVEGAQLVRDGAEVSVTLPNTQFAALEGAGKAGGAAADTPADGGGVPRSDEGSSHGGGNGLAYGLLGGLVVAGGVAAAAGGGSKQDTTAPTAPTGLSLATADDTGPSSSDRITNQTSGLTISGSAEANATVTLREGSTTLGTGKADANGNFSIDVALATGVHDITATATDPAGNASAASSALTITVDTAAPTVSISSSPATLLGNQTATITFTFSEVPSGFNASDVAVTGGAISNFAVSPTDSKVYTATLTPTGAQPGNVTIAIASGTFADVAGNSSAAAVSLNVAFDPGANGQAIDGYIANALVFRDSDNDGVWDHEGFTDANNNGLFDAGESFIDADGDGTFTAEFHTTTDAQGNFSNLFGSGRIVLTPLIAGNGTNLSRDISTGQSFTGRLTAPDGSTVVTPLTTIVEALAGVGATAEQIAAAQGQVKAALGLDAGVDLTVFDPIAVAAQSEDAAALANAVAVQKAAIQVANILTVMAAASAAAEATNGGQTGIDAAVSVIATQVESGGAVNLSDTALIGQIVQAVAEASGSETAGTAITAQAGALGSSLANINSTVQQAEGSNVIDTFAAIVTAQIVAQETLATDVNAAITNDTVFDSSGYEGAALASKIDEAATQVQVIVPTELTTGTLGAPDRPTIDDGARVSAAEAVDGIVVTITYSADTGVAAGDEIHLSIGGTVVRSVVLTSGDIPAAGATGTIHVPISAAELGADGTKSITAGFISAGGVAGAISLPAVLTLDTVTPAPAGLALAAADDSGASSSDRITSKTSGLTISGTAEANVTVTLLEGSTTLGTATADVNGAFILDVALPSGAHSITATATDAAGNVSPLSSALTITVDNIAPAAPTGLAASEGPLVTVVEAADGTVIAGTAEAGSTVTVTLTNGSQTLVKQAAVTGTAFALTLSAAEIAQLGEGYVQYSAVATDAAGNVGPQSAIGQYFYTRQPIGDSSTRLDGAGARVDPESDDGGIVGVTPLDGGGFVVHWVVDAIGDGDGLAVQRFAADGSKIGGVTVLQGISQDLLNNPSEDVSFDLRALDNGGYALSYVLGLEEAGSFTTVTASAPNQSLTIGIAGRPTEVVVQSAPAGANFALSGTGTDGAPKTVPLTVVGGQIVITEAILDEFAIDNRFGLIVNGVPQGQSASVFVETLEDVRYDVTAALTDVASSFTVLPDGVGLILTMGGRPEAFHIDSASGNPNFVVMHIMPVQGGFGINLAGISGATLLSNGVIQIFNPAPDTNGVYHVPEAILSQLGEHGEGDAQAVLILGGLAAGSTLTGTVSVRDPIAIPEGVFVQTFDENGVAQGDHGARLDGAGARVVDESEDGGIVGVTPLDGGGFVVHWVVDATGDGDGDGLAVQRFAADGTKVGGVTALQGISQDLLNNPGEDVSFDLRALDNGGYALTYTLGLNELTRFTTANATAQNPTLGFPIVGRPSEIYIQSALEGASFALSGTGNDGTPKTVALTVADGQIVVTEAILDQFGVDNRFNLVVTGVPQGQGVSVGIEAFEDVRYDMSAALTDVASSSTVLPNGTGAILTRVGRPEAFHIDSASYANGIGPSSVEMQINPFFGGASINLAGISGATLLPNGVIRITGVTPDANGVYHVPEAILSQLGEHGEGDAQAVLIVNGLVAGSTLTGTVSVRDPIAVPEGVFVQTFDENGVAQGDHGARLDGAGARVVDESEDGGIVGVTPLDGGGFVVHWVVDATGDGDGDGLAVQRFAADGAKVGGVTVLQGISQDLLNNPGEDVSFDLRALDNGGYALTYTLGLEEVDRFVTVTAQMPDQTLFLPIVGRPADIFINSAPESANFALIGTGNDGAPKTVALTVVDGEIVITEAILDQFAVDNRLTLQLTGVPQGQSVGLAIDALVDVRYDPTAALHDVASSSTVLQGGIGVLSETAGRAEAFHIGSAVYANGAGPSFVVMQVIPADGAGAIDLSGISGASLQPNGVIQIFNPTPDANGVYHVPDAIVSQLGDGEVRAFLILGGLTVGSTLTGTVSVHDPIAIPEGVFVQTFDENGVAVSSGLELMGTAGNDRLVGDVGNDVLTGGAGSDTLTGGTGADLFVLDSPGGQTLSVADLITDFAVGADQLKLSGGLLFSDVQIVQGDPSTNGAASADALIINSASGDILARLANTDAATITQTSFMS